MRAGYAFKMKTRQNVVDMAAYLVLQGLTTREVRARLDELYHVQVSLPTVSAWAKKGGVTFAGRVRLKPCRWCGSGTRHKLGCPVLKNASPKEDPLEKFSVLAV